MGDSATVKVLAVDDDPVMLRMADAHFQGVDAYVFEGCDDPFEAWKRLVDEGSDFSAVILDWVLPQLSGLALFNRIRNHPRLCRMPVLVVSGSISQQDFVLLKEFPATRLIQKPFTKNLVLRSLNEIIDEATAYQRQQNSIEEFLLHAAKDGNKALSVFRQVVERLRNPIPLAIQAGRTLRAHGFLSQAETILKFVLERDDRNLAAFTELAKVYHLSERHDQALPLLRLAYRYSPKNLDRLLLMGEVNLQSLRPDEAKKYFLEALEVDAENEKAQAGQTVAENMQDYFAANGKDAIPKSFASMLNMIGVTLVRNEQFEKGVEQYRSALNFVTTKDDTARVAFNMGLAYIRWGKRTRALEWFQRSMATSAACREKSEKYIAAIEDYLTSQIDSVDAEPVDERSMAVLADDADEVVLGEETSESSTSAVDGEQDSAGDDAAEAPEVKKEEKAA